MPGEVEQHMLAAIAAEPAAPGLANEDFAAVTTDTAVLLDGAGIPPGSQSGCVHGVAWYARMLGSRLLAEAAPDAGKPLPHALADAIAQVRSLHEDKCDLTHGGSPSATVIATRLRGEALEYLVLVDSVLLLDTGEALPEVVTDDRLERAAAPHRERVNALAIGSPEHATARREYVDAIWSIYRNREGGYWVASTDPAAADHALTGSVPLTELRSFALLSDGATRLADRFGLLTWPQLAGILRDHGPRELLRRTRAAEESDPRGSRWPRTKAHDDATAVYCQLQDGSPLPR